MNAPLLLTSVALLYGVAARPVSRQPDEVANQDIQSHDSSKQVYLYNPSASGRSDAQLGGGLNLDNIPHTPVGDGDGFSPKLVPLDSTFSDPGLSSPYIGAQRHLTKTLILGLDVSDERQDALSTLSPMPSRPTSPIPSDGEHEFQNSESNTTTLSNTSHDYNSMVVIMIVASLCALVLLGLAVAVAYVSQLLRLTVLQNSVWRTITSATIKTDVSSSATPDKSEVFMDNKYIPEGGFDDEKQSITLTRQLPSTLLESDLLFEKESRTFGADEDPEIPIFPHTSPALRESSTESSLAFGRAILAWTYDNWLTHFMFALFGWVGMFLRGFRPVQD